MIITKSTKKSEILKLSENCERCNKCCTFGSGILTEQDITNIASYLKQNKKEFIKRYLEPITKFNTTLYRPITKKKPFGECIFLNNQGNNKGCTIHEVKPLQCRISSCGKLGEDISVWFTLNYFVNENDPESIRQWSLYLKTGNKNIPGGSLKELVPDEKKLKQILNYEILK